MDRAVTMHRHPLQPLWNRRHSHRIVGHRACQPQLNPWQASKGKLSYFLLHAFYKTKPHVMYIKSYTIEKDEPCVTGKSIRTAKDKLSTTMTKRTAMGTIIVEQT
jgi:hypothetical protein